MPLPTRSLKFRLVLAGVVSLVASGGCRDAEGEKSTGPQFAFVTNGVASFWRVAAAGARKAGSEAGAEVAVIMPESLADQTRKLEDLVTRGVEGVAVSPINSANQIDILNRVAQATHLVTHDCDAAQSNRAAYVGMDNYVAGRMCGDLVRGATPDGGEVMLFVGRIDQDNAHARRQGCIDAIVGRSADPTRRDPPGAAPESEDGKYRVLGTLIDRFDRAKAKANAEDALTRHPDIACMVGLFVYNPPAILEALERSGRTGEVKVVAFDEDEVTLQAIADGKVVGSIVQDPFRYGIESIRILDGLRRGDKTVIPEGGFLNVPPRTITQENLEPFWNRLREQLAEQP